MAQRLLLKTVMDFIGGSIMKKHTIFLAIFVFSLTLFAQEIQEKAIAINIEVPVRVFKGKTFIDNLTIDDFEIYEEGVLQKTEAVYLINKMDIVREDTEMKKEEARKIFAPKVSRNFVFLFEMHEYLPTVGKAIELFFDDVFLKGDTLLVVTPSQSYHFDNKVLDKLTEKEISKQLIAQLRKDLRLSSSVYRGLLIDLEDLRKYQGSGAFEPDLVRLMHDAILTKLINLKYIDEKKMVNFVDTLERVEGPKHVFFFLQKLVVPTMGTNSADIRGFQAYMSFDENKIKQIFSRSSITAYMIYVTKTSDSEFVSVGGKSLTSTNIMNSGNPQAPRGMQDLSGNFFSTFKDIAEATGGIVESTTNVAASFKKAADASENYYLLYYF